MKALLRIGLSLFLLFLLFKNVKPQELTDNMVSFSAETIFYSISLLFVSWGISTYKWRLLVPSLSFERLLSATFVGHFYSTILPGQIAGEIVKAYRLGKGRVDAEQIAASVLVDKLIGLLGLLVVASVGLMVSHAPIPIVISLSIGLCMLFIFIGLFSLKISFVYLFISSLLKKMADRWSNLNHHLLRIFKLLDAWESYLTQPLRLFYAFLFAAVFQLICVWIIILFSHELMIDLPFADWCWIFGLVSIAVLLPISVGGIGVREGAFAGALLLQGVPIDKSIALSLAVFAISLLGALIGGLLEIFNSRPFRTFYTNMQSSVSIATWTGIQKRILKRASAILSCRLAQRFLSSKQHICYEGKFRFFNRFRSYFYKLVKVIEIHSCFRRRNFLAFLILAVIAFLYDGLFYNYSFNWADEGSVALISEKLFKGEKPYIDIEIGYGILWYLPIVLLFKAFGVKFYLIRIYFLVIAFASALFAHGLMLRLTSNRFIAFTVALLVLLFPGCSYQTYIPFLVISGLYILFLYDVKTLKPIIAPWLALSCNGIYLGIAYLIRGDIATVYTFLFLVYHGILVFQVSMRERCLWKLFIFPARIVAVATVIVLVALPFALEANVEGYLDSFLHQYTASAEQLALKIQQRFFWDSSAGEAIAGTLLPRPSLLSVIHGNRQGFIFLTYAPIFTLLSIGLFLAVDFFRERLTLNRFSDFISKRTYLIVLTIGAYSAFPQFFVWRPDMDHLSGFIPGFMVLMAYFLFVLGGRLGVPDKFTIARRWIFYVLGAFCEIYLIVFAGNFEEGPYLRRERYTHLRMEKGIDVYLNRDEFWVISQLSSAIKASSRPDEFVLCFPYCPGLNYVADRPTFQKYLYADDSFLILHPRWLEDMRDEIVMKRPRVIVINDWAINNTEISRFRNWAKPVYDYVNQMYERKLDISGYEVFVLR